MHMPVQRAFWFGPSGRPLFGRCWAPDGGEVRGGVVLCPPLGVEAQATARAYRALGERLAGAGFVALYLDYDGTGNSAGSEADPERTRAWGASVLAGVELLRSAGAPHMSVVGMRVGAAIAASVAAQGRLDALVLWDPCDGRAYLREQSLMKSVYVTDEAIVLPKGEDDGAVETMGTVYPAAAVAELSELRVEAAPGPWASNVLALLRPQRTRGKLREHLADQGADVADAEEQDELLQVWPLEGIVPEATIQAVLGWLGDRAGTETTSLRLSQPTRAVLDGPDGRQVDEEILSIGPGRLFGILTQPHGPVAGPTLVLLNAGRLDHRGPGRLWVEMARRCAGRGARALRVDLAGLGDSPARPGQEANVVYPDDAMEDISDVIAAVVPEGPSGSVVMGLCSGAYHAVAAAQHLPLRGIVAVNPLTWERSRRAPTATPPPTAPSGASAVEPGPSAAQPGPPAVQPGPSTAPAPVGAVAPAAAVSGPAVAVAGRAGSLKEMLKKGEGALRSRARRLPGYQRAVVPARRLLDVHWWVANRRGHQARGSMVLKKVVERDVDVLVLCRAWEGRMLTRGEQGVLRRLRKHGGFRLEVLDGIDHTLFLQAARDQAVPLLVEHVLSLR